MNRWRPRSVLLLLALLIGLAFPSLTWAQTADATDAIENQKLEKFLADHQLDSLLLEHLESQLQSTFDSEKRKSIAVRLANLYADQLLKPAGQSQQWLDRTRALVALYPDFKSGRLRVATLHARYRDSDKRFRKWWQAGALSDGREELSLALTTLGRDLDAVSVVLKNRSEDLFATRQIRSGGDIAITKKIEIVDAELLHCHFLEAWSVYLRAVVDGNFDAETIDLADLRFREFLQLDPDAAVTEYDSQWFDFSSPWHVRALVGLANIETVRGKRKRAKHIWTMLSSNGHAQDRAVFELNSLCFARQFELAADLATAFLSPDNAENPAAIPFAITSSHAAMVARKTKPAAAKKLVDAATAGLARQRAGDLLNELIETLEIYAPRRDATATQHMVWGYSLFWNAESSDGGFETAQLHLTKALEKYSSAEGDGAAIDRERCRFLLGWINLRQEKYDGAAKRFADVTKNVRTLDTNLAAEASWQSTKLAMSRRGGSSPGQSAIQLGRFLREFPESRFARMAALERMKLELQTMPPQKALQKLDQFPEDHESRAAILLEYVRQEFRLWKNLKSPQAPLDSLRLACQRVGSEDTSSPLEKSQAWQFLLDAMLQSGRFDNAEIEQILQRAKSQLGAGGSLELTYREFLVSQQQGDKTRMKKVAMQLIDSGRRSRFEVPVLISLAQLADEELTADPDDESLIQSTMKTWLQLSNRLGTDPKTLRSNRNARVSFARLGELQVQAGFLTEAKATFRKLLSVLPDQTRYLRGLALVETEGGNTAEAIELWGKLSSGVGAGSDLWFESKLNTVKLLFVGSPDSARKLLKQTRLLGGEVPSKWQPLLDTLDQELNP